MVGTAKAAPSRQNQCLSHVQALAEAHPVVEPCRGLAIHTTCTSIQAAALLALIRHGFLDKPAANFPFH